ncbi:acyltransferase family protein [Corynebacterium sp. 335C]
MTPADDAGARPDDAEVHGPGGPSSGADPGAERAALEEERDAILAARPELDARISELEDRRTLEDARLGEIEDRLAELDARERDDDAPTGAGDEAGGDGDDAEAADAGERGDEVPADAETTAIPVAPAAAPLPDGGPAPAGPSRTEAPDDGAAADSAGSADGADGADDADTARVPAAATAAAAAAAGTTATATAAPGREPKGTRPDDARRPAAEAPRKRPRGRIRRVPGIDGLRGLAVAAVVVYHFFGDVLPGGYLGVDVFFVLSGFLITSLLVRERAVTGRIDLKDFWLRRVRRILPAAMFVLVITIAAAGIVGGDPSVGLGSQFLGTLFFANNWVQIAGSQSYFADSGVQITAHYWSLAVEEQFYVLWPLAVVGLYALRRGSRPVAFAFAGLALASLVLMVALYDPEADPTRVYYGTDTHAFGLLIGALLAVLATTTFAVPDADSWPAERGPLREKRTAAIAGVAALVGLVLLFLFLGDQLAVTYRGGLFAASLLTAVLLLAVVREAGPVSALFRSPPMRWLGERSFSLYLWHWPVMILTTELLRDTAVGRSAWIPGLIALAVSLPLSAWSYRWVETPVRRRGYRAVAADLVGAGAPAARRIIAPAAAGAVAALAISGIVTSPDQTRLEADLEAAKAQQTEAEQAEEADLEKREMPTGDQITAIGDSVMLASQQALQEEFPGIHVDGGVSRHWNMIPPIIDQMKAEGTLDPFVVLGLGTNGPAGQEELDALIEQIGEDHVIVLVLPYGDRWYMPEAEAETLAAAERHDNVIVADWCHAARDDLSLLRDDLIHPTPPGALAYSGALRDALQSWVDHEETVPGVCGV